ncbi:MAG: ABC transporter ATP-binding protein [Bacillota bacterium]
MSHSLINVENVTKKYQSAEEEVWALRGVSLDVCRGEFLAIMGHSGSGKSTLLSVLGGLIPPSSGVVIIDDLDIYALSAERRADFRREYLGFVFQQFQLIPYLTALENVMLPLVTINWSSRHKREKAGEALQRVGLGRKINRLPHQLSVGEQERVAIARAIVNDPPLILADEPTGSLDTLTGNDIIDLFQKLNADGLTILMVTHNRDNMHHVSRAVFIQDGRVETQEPKAFAAACGLQKSGTGK